MSLCELYYAAFVLVPLRISVKIVLQYPDGDVDNRVVEILNQQDVKAKINEELRIKTQFCIERSETGCIIIYLKRCGDHRVRKKRKNMKKVAENVMKSVLENEHVKGALGQQKLVFKVSVEQIAKVQCGTVPFF